jgi:hypothetical protein
MNKLFLLFIMVIFLIGCRSRVSFSKDLELLYGIPENARTYFLTPPEMWYADKAGRTYTVATGLLKVRRASDNSGFLFKKGESQNIYFWKNGTDMFTVASRSDWEKGEQEMDQFGYYNMDIERLVGEEISQALMDLTPPQGKQILDIERTELFLKILSFTGKIRKARSLLPFLGGGHVYTGEIFLEFYSNKTHQPVLGLKKTLRNKGIVFTESFWYNDSMYLIEDDSRKIVVVTLKDE